MKRKLLYFMFCLMAITFSNAQVTSVAIVGESVGGWPGDIGNPGPIDVHQMTSTDGVNWSITNLAVTAAAINGGAKFRANNAWTINWGSASFPNGTGTQNGANIVTLAGTYDVTFNSTTGVYTFTGTPIVFPTVAIVGPGTAAGIWPNDPQVDPNPLSTTDGVTYRSNSIALTAAEIKFRQNNSWAVSWGGLSFPTGPTSPTSNILVTTAGNYRVVFNKSTGAYTFDFPSIAIVGDAVGGWPGEPGNPGPIDVHQLTTTNGETYTINNLVVTTAITDGGAKFRQDNSWTTSWGSAAFPSASSSDGANILTVAGTYNVTFTRSTGAYNFALLSTKEFETTSFKAYPNPTTDNWYFNSSDEAITRIQIVDVLGKTVISKNPNSVETLIDAFDLTNGIYFAKIETANATTTLKLIKN